MDRVKNKTAVITGGSMGLGRAAAMLLAKEGAKVAIADMSLQAGIKTLEEIRKEDVETKCICGINECEGRDLAEEICRSGGEAEFFEMNVAIEEDVSRVFKQVNEKFGKIDILVNNAGISGVNKPTHEVTLEEWQKVIDVNVNGVFLCTKHVIPYMKKNGSGSIINISSIYGIAGAPDVPPYHASKGAVRIMTKTDAMIYAQDKIRVNSIHPGYIWTPMLENFASQSGTDIETLKGQLGSLHPLGHIGEPDDIAYGVLYLASDESKFVTGLELLIDGGYLAR